MDQLRVVVAKPLAAEYVERIRSAEPRIDLVIEPDLLPPMRWPSDHDDPAFRRTPNSAAFRRIVDSAEVLYNIPTPTAALQRRCANPRWKVQTMAAGWLPGQAASLLRGTAARTFTTSAGVHASAGRVRALRRLAGAKGLPRLLAHKAAHHWSGAVDDEAGRHMTVVVVGMGIGQECARRFAGLGATVIGVNRSIKQVDAVEKLYTSDQIVEAAQGADALVNALPGAVGTEGLISRAVLEALKPGAIIASVGRGACIDEDALIELAASDRSVSLRWT